MALLELTGISKRFGGVRALAGVDLSVEAGEIRGLVGENGSGKTTLMRVLAGVTKPDDGRVVVDGLELHDLDQTERLRAGVGVVFQDAYVCPDLTVGENMFLGQLPGKHGRIRWSELHRRATAIIDEARLPIRSTSRARTISQDAQHFTEVARVLARDCQVLVFDETTASLTRDHVERLFAVIRRKRDEGAAVVFISHRLDEVMELCSTVTVLRDGQVTGTVSTAEVDDAAIVRLMVGRTMDQLFARRPSEVGGAVLQVRGLQARRVAGVDLDVGAGEVVGIGGLVGSGRSTVLEAIFGLTRRQGEVLVAGVPVPGNSPRTAIRAGVGLVPEERRSQGLAMELSIRANATMVLTGSTPLASLVTREREDEVVRPMLERLSLKAGALGAPVRTLSGGNQQKVVLGRWLTHRPPVLLLDEPTRGIDIGAKREIYDLIEDLAASGTAILLVSSELPELLGVCDRILVMREGAVVGEFARGVTEEEIGAAMTGALVT